MKSFFSYIHTCILQLYICNMYLGGVYKYVNVYDFNIFFSKDNIIHQTYFKIFVYEVLIASDPRIREGCKYNFGYLKVHIYCSIYLLESLLKPNFKSFPKSFWQNHDFFLPISLFSHLFFVPLHFFFPFFLFSSLFPSYLNYWKANIISVRFIFSLEMMIFKIYLKTALLFDQYLLLIKNQNKLQLVYICLFLWT